jgi:outer membrane receptor for ferrienterochelin and colicin
MMGPRRMTKLEHISRIALTLALLAMASSALADVRTEARRHFRRGMALVADGEVDEGIAELELAYETLPHPNVLYNIARAYAEAGRYEESIEYFERYLASDPPDREEVQGFLEAVEARIAANQETETPGETEGGGEPTETAPPITTVATDEEIDALEESATQIATLAEATQSDSLRARAERLRQLAQQLREAQAESEGIGTTEPGEEGPMSDTPEAVQDAPSLELGSAEERNEALYEETVVSASRYAQSPLSAPNSTAIITPQDIRLTGHRHVGELIRRVAGSDVMTLTPADTAVSFRGFNQRLSARTLVLIDGRSTYIDPLGATLWASFPYNVEDIERIEVIRGPASALYGADAFSGIVNIITRPPGEPRTTVAAGGGSGGQAHLHASTSGRVDRLAYRFGVGYNRADRFTREVADERVDHYFTRKPDIAWDAAHINGHLTYRVSEEIELFAQGGLNTNTINFQGTGPLRDFLSRGETTHAMAGLRSSWGSLRFFWNGLRADAALPTPAVGADPLETTFNWNTYDVEGELAREFHFVVDHNLHLGASYRRKQIDWTYIDQERFENHGAVFFQDTLGIVEQLDLVLSFRVDFHPLLDAPVFSPRGALVVKPTDDQSIRASFGTAFRTQTFLESYLSLPNPTPVRGVKVDALGSEPAANLFGAPRLNPERILSAELGYRNEMSDYFDVQASAYYNRVTDLVILGQVQPFTLEQSGANDPAIAEAAGYDRGTATYPLGYINFQNDPSVFDVVGGELELRAYPVTGLDFYANYAFNQTFVSNSQLRETEERTSKHKVNFGLQYRSPFGLDFGVDFHWVSDQVWLEQVFDAEEGVKFEEFDLDSYHMINARIGLRLLDDDLNLGIAAYNLTNNKFRQHPFGQRLEARVMGTVSYTF